MPFEVWLVRVGNLDVENVIELQSANPSVHEAQDDAVFFGGQHLYRGGFFTTSTQKIGAKLGGFVDHVALLRPSVLCGAGAQGELLLNLDTQDVIHKRKGGEVVRAMVTSADGRAVWLAGHNFAWVLDPDHLSGYMRLRLHNTSAQERDDEELVALTRTSNGCIVLGARDGAVALTNRALRIDHEWMPAQAAATLALCADEHFVYALRPHGVVHRFLVQPPPGLAPNEELPPAQTAKLTRHACALTCVGTKLVAAGPTAHGELGQLWAQDIADLQWTPLALGKRTLHERVDTAGEGESTKRRPDFTQVRNRIEGPALATLPPDDVVSGHAAFWVTKDTGTLIERPLNTLPEASVLAADTLVLPAMFRMREGTARPGLVLWPGVVRGDAPPLEWLTWGDAPRGWLALHTPEIRTQKWTRRDVFPLQIALREPPPTVPGNREPLPAKWHDPETFNALAAECKRLLKVVW